MSQRRISVTLCAHIGDVEVAVMDFSRVWLILLIDSSGY